MRLRTALLALLPLVLPAQEASLGFRAQALAPMGDLRDLTNGQVGLGAAAFIRIPLSRGLVLRPLVGAQYFPEGDENLLGNKTTVGSVDLMLEALWFPNEDPDQGPYLVGALGGQQWRIRSSGSSSGTTSVTRLGASGGLGYQFSSRLGFEARGFWSPVQPDLTATGLMAAVTIRF